MDGELVPPVDNIHAQAANAGADFGQWQGRPQARPRLHVGELPSSSQATLLKPFSPAG